MDIKTKLTEYIRNLLKVFFYDKLNLYNFNVRLNVRFS
jgi:hypothetical protein